jgi:hypothetical protein
MILTPIGNSEGRIARCPVSYLFRGDGRWRLQVSASTIGDHEQNITMTRSAEFTPAYRSLPYQFPAKIINRERK